jgi:UDP-2-acetamido-3-amino-2,3-dideoxy-glucuronate N-acetyltransferase
MKTSTPSVALIGHGYWGRNLARNLSALGALAAVCDADPRQLEAARAAIPSTRVTTDCAELLTDPQIDAVAIATSAVTHHGLARQALLAGKDVFVEKPLAMTAAQGRELVDLAAATGRILMVGHLLRYHPAVLKLKELIDGGALGRLQYVYSNRLNLGRFRSDENILWSFAPHDISAMLYLLGEEPTRVSAHAGSYLNARIPDVTVTTLEFGSGVRAHIFVSWLHPYKEQKLVVVGDRGMAVFDDVEPHDKLVIFRDAVSWIDRMPVPRKEAAERVPFDGDEPLRRECQHFLDCVRTRTQPITDGAEGLRVLEVLQASQQSLDGGASSGASKTAPQRAFFAHETAIVDPAAAVGEGTRIWHFSHVMRAARIGGHCSIGQNVFVAPNVVVGNHVKIQNNVSLYDGVILEDYVFCGPSMVFTNVMNPRSAVERKNEFRQTLVRTGASIGANATIVCGTTLGRHCFVGAGSVVTRDVPDYAMVHGNPARVRGWMCRCGEKLAFTPAAADDAVQTAQCPACESQYEKRGNAVTPVAAPVAAGTR